jgi:DNA ligase (NAD+)
MITLNYDELYTKWFNSQIDLILGENNWEWTENDKNEYVEIRLKNRDTNPEVIFKSVLDFFVSLKVEVFKEASLEKLFDAYNLHNMAYDKILYFILDLTEVEFSKVLGVNGVKSYNSLHRKLENITMPTLLGSTNFLGVGFGVRKSEIILGQVSFDQLKTMTVEQIAELDGFDVKTAANVVNGLPNFITFMDNIKDYLKFKVEEEIVVDADSPLSKVNVVVTGFRDDELEKIIKQSGGKVSSGVSKKTTHVIAAGKSLSEGSGKTEKAVELGIPVVSPEQFRELFNI